MEQKYNKALIIVDMQNDFIDGTMAVNGAKEMCEKFSEWLKQNRNDYSYIIFTYDNHPSNHCSFISEGGQFPIHCLMNSTGAAINDLVYKSVLLQSPKKYKVIMLPKGSDSSKEEYSAFDDSSIGNALLKHLKDNNEIDEIHICGLVNEYCVLSSLKSILNIFPNNKIKLLENFICEIKDKNVLYNFANDNKINIIS